MAQAMSKNAPMAGSIAEKLPFWKDCTIACIATGPSLTREQVNYCRGKARTVVVNDAFNLAPWADVLYFADKRWFEHHRLAVTVFPGLKVTIEQSKEVARDDPGIVVMRCGDQSNRTGGRDGLCLKRDGIKTGRNSGYQAINLAVHMGAKRILLLGYDMKSGEKTHFFGDHPEQWKHKATIYETTFIPAYRTLPPALAKIGVEVLNCTPGSAMDVFPMVELGDVL